MREMDDMGCSQTVQSHQTYMLVFLIVILLPKVHADCPVNDPCSCIGKNLICENIGDVSQVPPLNPSNTTYEILEIKNTPTLTTVQNNAFSGLKVKIIELRHLGLTRIEEEAFSGLDDILLELKICYMHIDALLSPTLFSHLTQLRVLFLNNNQLQTISDGLFSNLTNLALLALFNNNLTVVSRGMFSQLTQLQMLSISNNQLGVVSDGSFSDLIQLRYLYLFNNRLTTLSPTLFNHLTQMVSLGLSNNQLVTLSDFTFSNLRNLETLFLSSNKLVTLSSNLFSNLINLTHLYISNNTFVCDCRLAWLRNSILHTKGIIKDYPICVSPPNVTGVGITTYNISSCGPSASLALAAVSDDDDDSVTQYVIIAVAVLVSVLLVVGVALYCRHRRINAHLENILPYESFENDESEIVPKMADDVPTDNETETELTDEEKPEDTVDGQDPPKIVIEPAETNATYSPSSGFDNLAMTLDEQP